LAAAPDGERIRVISSSGNACIVIFNGAFNLGVDLFAKLKLTNQNIYLALSGEMSAKNNLDKII
jgi:hypothetical protein